MPRGLAAKALQKSKSASGYAPSSRHIWVRPVCADDLKPILHFGEISWQITRAHSCTRSDLCHLPPQGIWSVHLPQTICRWDWENSRILNGNKHRCRHEHMCLALPAIFTCYRWSGRHRCRSYDVPKPIPAVLPIFSSGAMAQRGALDSLCFLPASSEVAGAFSASGAPFTLRKMIANRRSERKSSSGLPIAYITCRLALKELEMTQASIIRNSQAPSVQRRRVTMCIHDGPHLGASRLHKTLILELLLASLSGSGGILQVCYSPTRNC